MNREEFKAKANQRIDEISAKINELKAKRASVKEASKDKYEESIKELETRKADLQSKYQDLLHASDEKWEEVKSAFSSAADSFKEGFSKIASLF